MVKVMYNDQLVYKVVIWLFFGISLWKEKVALTSMRCIRFAHSTNREKDCGKCTLTYYVLYCTTLNHILKNVHSQSLSPHWRATYLHSRIPEWLVSFHAQSPRHINDATTHTHHTHCNLAQTQMHFRELSSITAMAWGGLKCSVMVKTFHPPPPTVQNIFMAHSRTCENLSCNPSFPIA